VNQAPFFESGNTDLNAFKDQADKIHLEALNQVKSAVPNFVKQYDLMLQSTVLLALFPWIS